MSHVEITLTARAEGPPATAPMLHYEFQQLLEKLGYTFDYDTHGPMLVRIHEVGDPQ